MLPTHAVQLRSQPCHVGCPYSGCGVPAAGSHLLGLVLETPGVGLWDKGLTLTNKKNSVSPSCRKKTRHNADPLPRRSWAPSKNPASYATFPSSPRKVWGFKLYLADVGYSIAVRCTLDKNSCNRISSCLPRRWGDVGRFLSLLGSQHCDVCCLLPTVMCPIKAKRGLLSIERSTWHIWSTCWHQLLFKGSVNSSSLFYPIFHSETQQGAFGRPWNKTARAVILFRVRLKLSPPLLPPSPPFHSQSLSIQVWPTTGAPCLD